MNAANASGISLNLVLLTSCGGFLLARAVDQETGGSGAEFLRQGQGGQASDFGMSGGYQNKIG
jgi:hypothetical protein